MGNYNSTVCRSSNGTVAANPDVAGLGIIIPFAASTVLVLAAVLYGYVTDSLPETTLTRLDYYLLSGLPKGLGPRLDRLNKWKYVHLTTPLKRLAPKIFGPDTAWVSLDATEVRKRRKDSLERFVLSLSDQQLVTGLAVLIAGYSQTGSMSAYHFNIVASLAWFSSATHLATLAVLKTYFREHTTVRNWRVIIMLVMLPMLAVAQVPGSADKDNSVPVFCYYRELPLYDRLTASAVMIFLLITYTEGIVRLYSRDIDWNILDSGVEGVVKAWSKFFFQGIYHERPYLRTAQRNQPPGDPSSRSNAATVRVEREKGRFSRFELNLKNSHSRMKDYAIATLFMGRELAFSFTVTLALLLVDLTYGLVQVFIYRATTPHGGIDGNQDEVSFGQLVPLLLLLLPMFTVGEIHSENHEANDLFAKTKTATLAEASAPAGTDLEKTSESENLHGHNFNKRWQSTGTTADESPSTTQAPNVTQDVSEAETYSTSLKTLLDSLEWATDPIAESENKRPITSIRSLESADALINKPSPNIKYKCILSCVIAIQFASEIMIALAYAGVFGSHKSSIAVYLSDTLLVLFLIGICSGTLQRVKEIKRESRVAS